MITRLSRKTLRYYDEKAILGSEAKDNITGYRYYNANQIQIGIKIKHLTYLGLILEAINDYLIAEEKGDEETINKILWKRLIEAERELSEERRVVNLLRKPKVVKNTMSEPCIKQTPQLRVISKRMKGNYDETIENLSQKSWEPLITRTIREA